MLQKLLEVPKEYAKYYRGHVTHTDPKTGKEQLALYFWDDGIEKKLNSGTVDTTGQDGTFEMAPKGFEQLFTSKFMSLRVGLKQVVLDKYER